QEPVSQKTDDELTIIKNLANNGQLEEARELCRRYVERNNLNSRGYYLLGNIFLELGDLARAEENFQKAVFLEPNFIMGHFALANVYSMKEISKESKRYYQNVLNLLKKSDADAIIPESDGLSVFQFSEMVKKIITANKLAS
ncbi:MAG: tetratricopeptide repeat protein, partial [Calditrichaeota bacterium]|nr:tetratricopeptide repeat protein [Calditrichota bacterium]